MSVKTVKEAINDALVQSFENDKNVILMGEDIAGGKGSEKYEELKMLGEALLELLKDYLLSLVKKECEILQ